MQKLEVSIICIKPILQTKFQLFDEIINNKQKYELNEILSKN